MSDEPVWQEFYCNDCDGYIRVRLNMAINAAVVVVCPKCNRKHPRIIKDGKIFDTYNAQDERYREEICPTMSAYSKTPFSANIKAHARDGAVITAPREPMYDRWFEIYGGPK